MFQIHEISKVVTENVRKWSFSHLRSEFLPLMNDLPEKKIKPQNLR